MTITSTKPSNLEEIVAPDELLIREAREATRRRRLRWFTVLIAAATIVSLVVVTIVDSSRSTSKVGGQTTRSVRSALAVTPCTTSSLRITVQNGDGLHHGVELLKFVNVSESPCRVAGYPGVKAVLDSTRVTSQLAGMYAPAPAGTLRDATDVHYSWAGGVDVGDAPPKTFVAPIIILSPHTGAATSTLNWIDGPNGNGKCPAFNDLMIAIGGVSVRRFVRTYEPLCYEFAVTPFVRGTTGSMFVRGDFSKKANALANAREDVATLRAAVSSLHHEMVDPHGFSFSEKLQTASYVQQLSQDLVKSSPWPKLNSSFAAVQRESDTLGIDAGVSVMQPGVASAVGQEYARFLVGMNSLEVVLKRVS